MLYVLRLAIDVRLICLSSTLDLLPNNFTPSLWLRFILGSILHVLVVSFCCIHTESAIVVSIVPREGACTQPLQEN